ncbi:MAG TPA: helix-turn-helix transcriptional regulator [Streptosporangiaceae bacterium]
MFTTGVARPLPIGHALLALLSEGPEYGLQLREEFEAGTGEVWPLNIGQVYTTVQRLATWLRTPPDMSAPPRDELVIKVLVALRLPGTDVREVIQAHRRYLVELMQQRTRIKEAQAERVGQPLQ